MISNEKVKKIISLLAAAAMPISAAVIPVNAQLSAGVSQYQIPYHDLIKGYGDMDGNGMITGSDATMILNMYTELSAK